MELLAALGQAGEEGPADAEEKFDLDKHGISLASWVEG